MTPNPQSPDPHQAPRLNWARVTQVIAAMAATFFVLTTAWDQGARVSAVLGTVAVISVLIFTRLRWRNERAERAAAKAAATATTPVQRIVAFLRRHSVAITISVIGVCLVAGGLRLLVDENGTSADEDGTSTAETSQSHPPTDRPSIPLTDPPRTFAKREGPTITPDGVIPIGDFPRAAALAPDGTLWIVGINQSGSGFLNFADPRHPDSASGVDFDAPNPYDIAIGADGIWITAGPALIQLDLDGNEVWRGYYDGPEAENEVEVANGLIWLKRTAIGDVVVLTPDHEQVAQISIDSGQATAIAAGEGAIWVTTPNPSVVRIDPDHLQAEPAQIPVEADPQDLVVAGGLVWIAHATGNELTLVDAAKREERPQGIPTGIRVPGGLAAGQDTILVAGYQSNDVSAISRCPGHSHTVVESGSEPTDVVFGDGRVTVINNAGGDAAVFRLESIRC